MQDLARIILFKKSPLMKSTVARLCFFACEAIRGLFILGGVL